MNQRSPLRRVRDVWNRSTIYARRFVGLSRLAALSAGLPEYRFLILSQGRTGSALLADIVKSHSEVYVDAEIFNAAKFGRVPFPALYLKSRAQAGGLSRKRGYCLRVKHSQLAADQRLKGPQGFLKDLYVQGWKIIYLRRDNIFRIALSTTVAKQRGIYHAEDEQTGRQKIVVDCDLLWRELESGDERQNAEQSYLTGIEYLALRYESDLFAAEAHQYTANTVFDYVGLTRATVCSHLEKTSTSNLEDMISNFEQVNNLVAGTRYAKYSHN